MVNMPYCRFENTARALQECYDALADEGGVEGVERTANQYEKPYVRKLIQMCKDIVDDYGDELWDDETGGWKPE